MIIKMVSIETVIERALLDKAKTALEEIVGEQYSDDLDAPYWAAVGDGVNVKVCIGHDGDFWLQPATRNKTKKKKSKKEKKIPWLRFDAMVAEPEELLDCIFDRLLDLEKHAVA